MDGLRMFIEEGQPGGVQNRRFVEVLNNQKHCQATIRHGDRDAVILEDADELSLRPEEHGA